VDLDIIVLALLGVAAVALMTQRWFWILLFFFGALTSFFAMVASAIHFQLLGAVGFLVLMSISGAIGSWLADG
jgi:hypothetical protein